MKKTSKHITIVSLFIICVVIAIAQINRESTSAYAMPLFITPPPTVTTPTPSPIPAPKKTVAPKQNVTPKPIVPISNDNFIVLINSTRATNGVGQLSPNAMLMKSAQAKADDMCAKKYWSHDTPDGKKFYDWIIEAGYHYRLSGENLARDCGDNRCMELWLNSPTHKDVMLDPGYREIGVGRCGIYKVTHFGVK